ncbi:MAG: BglI family type II restriction endonuclease [Symploca sp. SIO1C2]|nr:BglI family type II restriction endonuclease [Symploca sp. SIO1C2]
MFNKFRQSQYRVYQDSRNYFIQNYGQLIQLKQYIFEKVFDAICHNINEIWFFRTYYAKLLVINAKYTVSFEVLRNIADWRFRDFLIV